MNLPTPKIPRFLYHGTTANLVPSILAQGLLPRSHTAHSGMWDRVPSVESNVYLTSHFAASHAFNAAMVSCLGADVVKSMQSMEDQLDAGQDIDRNEILRIADIIREKIFIAAIIEIDTTSLDKSLFCPDEDFIIDSNTMIHAIAQYGDSSGTIPSGRVSEIADSYRAMGIEAARQPSRMKAMLSLAASGSCAYAGAIPVSALTRITTFPISQKPRHVAANVMLGHPTGTAFFLRHHWAMNRIHRFFTDLEGFSEEEFGTENFAKLHQAMMPAVSLDQFKDECRKCNAILSDCKIFINPEAA